MSGCDTHQWEESLRLPLADLLVRPFTLAKSERHEVFERLADAATICRFVVP